MLCKHVYFSRVDALYRESWKGKRVEYVCWKKFAPGSLVSHLASQHNIYHAHLMADKENVEEVCTLVPINPVQ